MGTGGSKSQMAADVRWFSLPVGAGSRQGWWQILAWLLPDLSGEFISGTGLGGHVSGDSNRKTGQRMAQHSLLPVCAGPKLGWRW